MQRIFKISLLLCLVHLFSCQESEIRKYKVRKMTKAQIEALEKLEEEKGIKGIEVDTINGEVIVEYSSKLNTLRNIEDYLDDNDLLVEEYVKINPKLLKENKEELKFDTLVNQIADSLTKVEDSVLESSYPEDSILISEMVDTVTIKIKK